jgi:hypothetical protein
LGGSKPLNKEGSKPPLSRGVGGIKLNVITVLFIKKRKIIFQLISLAYIAFPVRKRYIVDGEKLN